MKLSTLIEAAKILAKYAGDEDCYVMAEHDQIWIGDDEWLMSDEDRSRLDDLGFFPDAGAWSSFT